MQTIAGCITVAQESHFGLIDDTGGPHLFLLSSEVPLNPYALWRLATDRTRVVVRYEPSSSMVEGIAHRIANDSSHARGATAMSPPLQARYRDALHSLEVPLENRPPVHDAIEQATVDTVAVRDALIGAQRTGEGGHDDALQRVNALLSLIVSAEFPLVGVRWKRIESARDDLAQLARETG